MLSADDALALVNALIRDLGGASGWVAANAVHQGLHPAPGAGDTFLIEIRDAQGRTAGWVSIAAGDAALAAESAAANLQDLLAESAEMWGEPVPRCDLHGQHPMTAEVVDGTAMWRCGGVSVRPVVPID
ncbi:hypothetical protein [Nocardioides speluncae]|uniref:hypothetical protein n=1 Tax=Nocardioides speluncae TaxID=2670337 RepID=UPI000D69425E|nr:hypothetical protein [Nocardioides speluncae]